MSSRRQKLSKTALQKLDEDNARDDAIISKMSKQLGLKKRGTKSLYNDEFGGLLSWTDEFEIRQKQKVSRKRSKKTVEDLLSDDENNDSKGTVKNSKIAKTSKKENKSQNSTDGSESADESSQGADMVVDKPSEQSLTTPVDAPESKTHLETTPSVSPGKQKYIPPHMRKRGVEEIEKKGVSSETSTDSTSRVVPEAVAQKYVPPHLRTQTGQSAEYMQIKRSINSVINKITEKNLSPCATQITEIYSSKPRGLVRDAINEVVFSALVDSKTPIPLRLASDVTMLVAILHSRIGTSLSANLLENLVKKTHQFLAEALQSTETPSKESNNAIRLLLSLYAYKVIQVKLVQHLLDHLIATSTEKSLELLLLSLKVVGFDLRKRHAVVCRDTLEKIPSMQQKIEEKLAEKASSPSVDNTRLNFLLETVTAIKNNNVRKISDYDHESETRRRKLVKSCCGSGQQAPPLPDMEWSELLEADSKGRWWLVGSAWLGKQADGDPKNIGENAAVQANLTSETALTGKLALLAKKARMNTPLRRTIFGIVMKSDDFEDACQRLQLLELSNKQVSRQVLTREIVVVIVSCFFKEKAVNMYYLHILGKLSTVGPQSRSFMLSLRTVLWDRLKNDEVVKPKRLAVLVSKLSGADYEVLNLQVLKNIDFTEVNGSLEQFLQKYLTLIDKSKTLPTLVDRSALQKSGDGQTLIRSLLVFIDHICSEALPNLKREISRLSGSTVDL